jgi:hypothetical protein
MPVLLLMHPFSFGWYEPMIRMGWNRSWASYDTPISNASHFTVSHASGGKLASGASRGI